MRISPAALAIVFVSSLGAGSALAQPVTAALDYGRHPVGFRAVTEIDRSRTVQAKTTFDGTPLPGEAAMPLQIGIWYPAADAASGTPMSAEQYKTLWTSIDRTALVADFGRMLTFGELTATNEQLVEALTRQTRARRDAAPLKGPFPLIVAGASTSMTWPALEYIASHGYVVVTSWSSMRTATLQATQPAVALETQTRTMEYLAAFAGRQGLGDAAVGLGLIGVNFDGMAALNFEMRNMRADAVISLDGYEGKRSGTAMLQASPYFDPLRMRVPYLINLYAFRYAQRKPMNEALELRRLAAEAFPGSADAAYRLGVAASDGAQPSEAREAFTRALKLLDESAMTTAQKEAMRKQIRSRLHGTQ